MPEYPKMEAWIHNKSLTIFTGYKKRLEEVFVDVDKNQFTKISETAQARLGKKLISFLKKEKELGRTYTLGSVSGLNTLRNVLRYNNKNLFNEGMFWSKVYLDEWIKENK